MVVASTQATFQIPHREGADDPDKVPTPKRDAAAAGVQGAARDMGGAGDSSGRSAERHLESPHCTELLKETLSFPV